MLDRVDGGAGRSPLHPAVSRVTAATVTTRGPTKIARTSGAARIAFATVLDIQFPPARSNGYHQRCRRSTPRAL